MDDKLYDDDSAELRKKINRKTFVYFGAFAVLAGGGIIGWKWLTNSAEDNGIHSPLRTILYDNERLNQFFFSDHHLTKEYPVSMAQKDPRVNGDVGMDGDVDIDTWNISIAAHPGVTDDKDMLHVTLKDITSLPKRELTFDFKCVEGWSMITYWGGARFSDFLIQHRLGTRSGNAPDPAHPEDLYKYVGLTSIDGAYYVGMDMKSMMHPQTLLVYEVNGATLPSEHGYPLRLITPLKYGVKNLKRIGHIFFSDERPKDYWFEQGYDYDLAL